MVMLCAQSPVTNLVKPRALSLSGWTMCSVQELRKLWINVASQDGLTITATMLTMTLESYANLKMVQ